MFRVLSWVATVTVALSALLALSQPAAAHETRRVGPYQLVVGWLNEPAYQGQPNAATVRVPDTRLTPAKPLEGLETTLTIQVLQGGLTRAFSGKVRAVFGQAGLYALDLVPTVDGAYKIKLAGKIEALEITETFESGPGRYNDVQGLSALQYPQAVPAGADLGAKLDDLRSAIDQTRIAALAAVVLSVVGIALALRSRKA